MASQSEEAASQYLERLARSVAQIKTEKKTHEEIRATIQVLIYQMLRRMFVERAEEMTAELLLLISEAVGEALERQKTREGNPWPDDRRGVPEPSSAKKRP